MVSTVLSGLKDDNILSGHKEKALTLLHQGFVTAIRIN